MQIIRRKDQKEIKTDTCGLLLEVISQKDFPFGIVLSDDIKPTKAHYHTKSQKCYWVLDGWIEVSVENIKTGKKILRTLHKGDLITFEPYEKHQITKASKKNKMVTIKSPAWNIQDEIID